jgi:hypothetical protein
VLAFISDFESVDFLLAEATTDAATEAAGAAEFSAAGAGQAAETEEAVELAAETELAEEPAAMFATAAVISAAVASSTRRFCERMQPSASSATSQVLPLPVGSPI